MLKVQKPFLFSWQNCNLIIFYLERKAMQITNHILKEVMISELWYPKIKIKKNHLGGKIRTAINTEWSKWELYFLRNSIHCNQIYCVCGGGGLLWVTWGCLRGNLVVCHRHKASVAEACYLITHPPTPCYSCSLQRKMKYKNVTSCNWAMGHSNNHYWKWTIAQVGKGLPKSLN